MTWWSHLAGISSATKECILATFASVTKAAVWRWFYSLVLWHVTASFVMFDRTPLLLLRRCVGHHLVLRKSRLIDRLEKRAGMEELSVYIVFDNGIQGSLHQHLCLNRWSQKLNTVLMSNFRMELHLFCLLVYCKSRCLWKKDLCLCAFDYDVFL